MDMYVSCIKIFGVPIVPPLMTNEKRQQMKEYKEKAMAFENKLKGKRVSLDSGVMTASVEMPKLENYESPTNILKDPVYCDIIDINEITTKSKIETESSISPETPTLVSEEDEHNLNYISSDKDSLSIMAGNVSLNSKFNSSLIPKQESSNILTVSNLTNRDRQYLNNSSPDKKSSSIKSENITTYNNNCDTMIPKQKSSENLIVTNLNGYDRNNTSEEQIPRLRTNSYTLSSPSPIMVAFLNSQVQQQLIEPKGIKNSDNFTKETKSEPSLGNVVNDCDNNILKFKSISLHSVPDLFNNQAVINNLLKYRQLNINDNHVDDKTILDQSQQDERGSVTTIGTNFSNDESIVGSVVTVCNGNSNENNKTPSPMAYRKSMKNCCCRHSDDDYSLCSNSIQYKTPEELSLEAERLRIEKLEIEKRHQDELAYLIKKQREEQEQIAVRYYLITRSTSGMSLDDSEFSDYSSKCMKSNSFSIQSGTTAHIDKSIISDTSSITSNYSVNKNLVTSSPRPKTPSNSPLLQQNIKFYHRIRGSLATRWTKAPSEVENSAATIINAGVRGYLTRRLLRTEKAQLLKKTILDSLKTALIMHMELKKQKPTESDLELHRRIINQLTTACYDLNDLILGSVHERMIIIRSDRERLMAVKMRRKSSSALIIKPSRSLKQPKKSTSGYSLSKKSSSVTSTYSDKSSYKKY